MSSEKKTHGPALLSGLCTGALGLLLMLALLLAFAMAISKGYLPEKNKTWLIPAAAFLSGFAGRKLLNDGREEGALIKALISTAAMSILVLILSVLFRDQPPELKRIVTVSFVYAAGDLLGSMVRINKKYRRKHDQRHKYNS